MYVGVEIAEVELMVEELFSSSAEDIELTLVIIEVVMLLDVSRSVLSSVVEETVSTVECVDKGIVGERTVVVTVS